MLFNLKNKLFNGYVADPVPIIFFVVFIGLSLTILPIWATHDILNTEENLTLRETYEEIVEYDNDGPLILFISQTNRFSVLRDAIDIEKLIVAIEEREICKIQYIESEKNETYHSVVNVVSSAGKEIVIQQNVKNAHKENNIKSLTILWSVCIVYWVLTITSYYIISNAPRYPKLASLLIRKEYRNF